MSVFCKKTSALRRPSAHARVQDARLTFLSHEQREPSYHFGVTAEEQRSCRQELHYAGLKVLVFHMAEMLGPQKGT